jgi:L-asparaginase
MSKIVFLGTGGTIAGTSANVNDNVGYRAAQLRIEALLRTAPGLVLACHGHAVESEQVVQVDSKDMEFSYWLSLAIRARLHLALPDVVGLVITHGTDTIEETAYFLSRVLPRDLLKNKPVVLTCAMRPASSLATDGPQNLLDAACVVVTAKAQGVMVVCAGKVHSAQYVQKVHPYRVDAFDSGDWGVGGYIEEGVVRLFHRGHGETFISSVATRGDSDELCWGHGCYSARSMQLAIVGGRTGSRTGSGWNR